MKKFLLGLALGIVIELILFFVFAIASYGLSLNLIQVVIILPVTIFLLILGFRIFKKQTYTFILGIFVGVLWLITMGFFLSESIPQSIDTPNSQQILFTCQNGANLKVRIVNSKELDITLNNVIDMASLETASSSTYIYGNKEHGYTFVGGYTGQLIYTDRTGPTSTVCSEINHPS